MLGKMILQSPGYGLTAMRSIEASWTNSSVLIARDLSEMRMYARSMSVGRPVTLKCSPVASVIPHAKTRDATMISLTVLVHQHAQPKRTTESEILNAITKCVNMMETTVIVRQYAQVRRTI